MFTRRQFVGAAAAISSATAGLSLVGPAVGQSNSAGEQTFVLLHGAMHGGWCWTRVRELLEAKGHNVFTPTLTGLGERSHLLTRDVSVETHIQDIVNVLRYEGLSDVTFVAHSYAGLVAAVIPDRVPGAIKKMVFLDAILPRSGESWSSLYTDEGRAGMMNRIETAGEGWKIPAAATKFFGVTNPADQDWADPLITDHPGRTFTDVLTFDDQALMALDRTFIRCTDPALPTIESSKQRVREGEGWNYHELPTGHDAMITMPEALTELIIQA